MGDAKPFQIPAPLQDLIHDSRSFASLLQVREAHEMRDERIQVVTLLSLTHPNAKRLVLAFDAEKGKETKAREKVLALRLRPVKGLSGEVAKKLLGRKTSYLKKDPRCNRDVTE
eukprot:scaffold5744_cov159-Amphora_coffeaeformis.AAC.7